jgi:hypothetical protein
VLVFVGGLAITGVNSLLLFLAVDGGFTLFKRDIFVLYEFPIQPI